jgi:hypothetical protein
MEEAAVIIGEQTISGLCKDFGQAICDLYNPFEIWIKV